MVGFNTKNTTIFILSVSLRKIAVFWLHMQDSDFLLRYQIELKILKKWNSSKWTNTKARFGGQ